MKRLKDKFEEVEAFSATFRQALDTEFSASESIVEGTIILSKEKYRIETNGQTVVTDGETVWVYVLADQQVIVSDFFEDEGSFSPGHFLDERADRYDASLADEKSADSHVVLLSARSPDTYIESAKLWIDKEESTISRIDVIDVNGASIRFEMSNIDLAPDIDDNTFKFHPPEGVDVVDLR